MMKWMRNSISKVRWWLKNPRNYVLLGGVSTGLVATAKACPLLFPNQLYLPIMEAYKAGKTVDLCEQQRREFEEVFEELHIPAEAYHPFVTSWWEPKVKGQPYMPSGVLFGIPITFVDNPSLPHSTSVGIRANLDSEEGTAFKESLSLSEKARKFAIAKQVVLANKCYATYPLLIAPGMVLAGFAITAIVRFPVSRVMAIIVGNTVMVAYQYLSGVLNERHDVKTDRIVSGLGQSYIEGGIEYYEKSLKRNRALRQLLGSKGEKLYSYHGNEVPGMIRSNGAPLTVKRKHLKEVLEQSLSPTDV